ncbi:MAG: hypothetical protein KIH69_020530 [Anaerolineae bacterium]|nr:hypothetical protein [Anaerolineae bacterium]
MTLTKPSSQLLKKTLLANALFSDLCGAIMLLGASAIAPFIGLNSPIVLTVMGIGLMAYGLWLFLNARRAEPNLTEAKIAVAADLAWVIGAAVVILLGVLNTTGNWILAGVTDVVLCFAILQWVGIRRLQ